MLLHRPSFQKIIEIARTKGILSLPKSKIALVFSTFFIAAASLSNSQCESKLRQSRKALLKSLRTGTRYALVKAGFTRSTDLVTLQAFVQFLLCMRNGMDSQTLWVLSGAAFRVAQRMGVHREDVDASLPPFEAEMRRRLWHQLMILDFTASELAGCAPSYSATMMMDFDSRGPLNVNEEDLKESMKEMPAERFGATDMIFCRLRYEFRAFFMLIHKPKMFKMGTGSNFDASWNRLTEESVSVAEKDKCIDDLENRLQTNFLRFCDPINRLHNLTALAARAAVAGMRLRAHHPRQYAEGGKEAPQSEKDLCFSLSMKIMRYDIMCHAQKDLQGYIWHVRVYFQWYVAPPILQNLRRLSVLWIPDLALHVASLSAEANIHSRHSFIFLLNELRTRTMGDEADRAWDLCEESFLYHPELLRGDFALYRAIRAVALRAWDAREAELRREGLYVTVPQFIAQARVRAGVKVLNGAGAGELQPSINRNAMGSASYPMYGTPNAASETILSQNLSANEPALPYTLSWPPNEMPADDGLFLPKPGEPSPIDWDAWDSLVQMDLPTLEFGLEAFFK
jgi:hypothetical protein